MIRKPLRDQLAKHALDGQVHFGDEVSGAFLVDAERLTELRHLQFAGTDDRFDRGSEKDGTRRWHYA